MTGPIDRVVEMAEQFNQKHYAINVFPIGGGKEHSNIYTDKPVVMPTFKIGDNGGYIFRFFNPENVESTFNLTVNGKTQAIKIPAYQVISVWYDNGKFDLILDATPV